MKGLRIVGKTTDLRTSTLLDPAILELIRVSMNDGEYGPRQRSKWINEAIDSMATEWEACDESDQVLALERAKTLSGKGKHITVVLKPESRALVDMIKAFMKERNFRFDQSTLIHFAITYRLIKEKRL